MGAMLAPLLIVAPIPAFAQTVSFNVPEQPAITGIPEFARQARIQIVSPAGLQSLKTRAVKGRLSIDEGLQRLLRGTNLYVAARTGSVVSLAIRPRAAKPAPAPRPIRHPPPARQTPAPTPLPPPVEDDIVVTGTVAPQRKIDAGLAVTIASVDRIRELAPNNTADVLKLAPGIWAETTGGVTGANVFVRGFPTNGDAPFLTVQLDGAPIYPPSCTADRTVVQREYDAVSDRRHDRSSRDRARRDKSDLRERPARRRHELHPAHGHAETRRRT